MIPEPDIKEKMDTAHILEMSFLHGLKARKAKAGLISSSFCEQETKTLLSIQTL